MNFTILTRPPKGGKHLAKLLWEKWHGRPREGHKVLLINTVAGLRRIGISVALNHWRVSSGATHIMIASGLDTLRWALARKAVRPDTWVGIAPTYADAGSPQITEIANLPWDTLLAASPWHRHLFLEKEPSLAGRIVCWPCGVDHDYWTPLPSRHNPRQRVLIYHKRAPAAVFDSVQLSVASAGMTQETILYGSYTAEAYRTALRRCEVAIFLSDWESQGIALAEAWACNVPTLAWTPWRDDPWPITAPLLTPKTGYNFHLPGQLDAMLTNRIWTTCEPRQWVLANLTLSQSAHLLVQLAPPATMPISPLSMPPNVQS